MGLRERMGDLEALRRTVAKAVAGAGTCLLITAPAGLGKSALLAEADASAEELGARVRITRCHELERDLPWSAVRDLLDTEPEPAADPEAALATLRGLLDTVRAAARKRPLVLVVDDLQWCDRASLRFLVYLQQRLDRLPVSLVAAMRPPEQDDDDLLAAFAAAPHADVRSLRPLSPDSVCAIVREQWSADADDAVCAAIAQITGGNPFYLRELVGELVERGEAATQHDLDAIAPPSVSRAIAVRLRRHGDAATRLARAVAVLGDDAALAHAAALAELREADAVSAADALGRAQILVAGNSLSFAHPLVRAAVYSDIPPARRAADHLRAAALLAAAGAREPAAAQLLHAPQSGEPWAIAVLEEAGQRAAGGAAPELAAAFLRRALEEPAAADERRRLLIALGRAEGASGQPQAAERFTEAVASATDPIERARTLLMLGWTKHHQGRFAEAAREFQHGLDELEGRDEELATMLQLGFFTAGSLDAAYAAEAHARVARLERELPDEPGPAGRALLAQSLTSRTFTGDPHRDLLALADRVWSGGRVLREDGPNAETVWAVIAFWIWSDRYERALHATEAALADARRQGSALASARGWYARGWARYWTGDLDGAIADQRAAIEVWRGGMETYLPAAVYWLVLAQLEAGRVADARQALELAGAPARWEGTAFGVFLVAASARIALHSGDAAAALRHNQLAGELATQRLAVNNPALLPWRSQAALSALALGDRDTAVEYATDSLKHCERFGAPRAISEARRVAALTRPAADAVTLLERAAAQSERVGAPIEHARVLVELGAALRRSGRRADARVHLRKGLEVAEAHGARTLAEQARAELRASGIRIARAPGEEAGELTASEDRVARLAAAGRTNREIAAELRVSVKAVEFHLHTTYRKLGIRGRRELPGTIGPQTDAR